MKANRDTRSDHDATRSAAPWRRRTAIALVSVFGLAACTSDPGARRVAEDIIEAEFERGTISEAEKDCMFDVLEEDYTEGDLETIAGQIDNADPTTVSEGEDALAQLRSDLDACTA